MSARPRQLALALDHAESFAREDFLSGSSNAVALALIDAWPDWSHRMVMLTGPEGSGKSHLAAVWAQAAGARRIAARALEEANVPSALATGALVVEDIAAGAFDERALFHLLNLAGDQPGMARIRRHHGRHVELKIRQRRQVAAGEEVRRLTAEAGGRHEGIRRAQPLT